MKRKEEFRTTFVVPVTSGNYAPERITFGKLGSTSESSAVSSFLGITAFVESAPAGASLELWLPKVGADMNAAADASFFYFATLVTGVSGGNTAPLASVMGGQLRMKSGGTAADAVVNAYCD